MRRIASFNEYRPLIAILIGSGIALYIDLAAGAMTLALSLVALLLASRLALSSEKGTTVADRQMRLAERIKLSLSGNVEAKIFNYDDRVQTLLQTQESELSAEEMRTLSLSGVAPAGIHFIMGSNIMANAFIGWSALELGQIDTISLALLVLLPFIIFSEVEFGYAKREVRSQ